MVMAFLLSRINFIIKLKPFNFYFADTGKGLLVNYPLFNPARDSLFTLRRISRLDVSFIILPSHLEFSGCEI